MLEYDMSGSFNPLEKTTPTLHRVYFMLSTEKQWYNIIHEANRWFGRGKWQGQRRVRRQLARGTGSQTSVV
jgi:hypothetical protein